MHMFAGFVSLLTYDYHTTEQLVSPVSMSLILAAFSSAMRVNGRDTVNSSQFGGVSATSAEGCLASLRRDRRDGDGRGISLTDAQERCILAHMAVAQMFHVS